MERRRRPSPNARRPHLIEHLEVRNLLAASPFGTNPLQPLDVTRDGNVSALDALRVINALNRSEDGSVDPADSLGSFVDVTGDGRGTALDALRVINALNREAPLIAATLPNDSGPAERTDLALDLLTNNYNIDLNVSVGELADNKVRIRIGKDNAFADITDQFTEGSANLTPTEIDDYFGNPLPDGDHEITVQIGEDGDAINFVLTLDRQTPVPQLTSGPLLRISPNQLVVTFGESVLGEDVTSEDFRLQQLGAEAITIASTEVLTDRIRLALPAHLPDAGFELTYTGSLTDLAGNVVTQGVVNAFTVADPTGVVEISPANGEELVNVKRETIVRFDEPVDPATVTDASFYVIANGERVPGNIRVSRTELFATLFYEDPLPASTEVRVILDGGQIIGRDGLSLDGDGDDEPGGVITADFRTLPLTQISGTELFGFVKDSQTREPLAGVRISLEAFPQIFAVTDEAGFFEIGTQDLDGDGQGDGLPAPEFFAHIDGSTVTNQGGKVYASLGKPFPTVPGQREQLRKNGEIFDIFLPSISPDAIKTLTAGQDTQVGFGASDRQMLAGMFPDIDPAMFEVMRVTIVDEAAQNDQGEPATEAFVVPVDPDFLPAPLPPNLNPELVISVQTPGATNFDTPAAVSFPNLEGNVPGQKVLLFSFDHDKGEFVVNGTATVSEDGMSIASDPGVGIQAPGWHFVQSGTETDGKPGDEEDDEEEEELTTFQIGITADGTVPRIDAGVDLEVSVPPLLDINDKISFNSQPTPFGPVSLVNASFSIGKESLAARVLRQFTGDLLLASGGAKGKFSIGLEATSGGVDVDEDDTFAEVKLPGGSFGGVSLSVSAGGLPCRVAGYFSGFSQLCGGGVTVVLGLGISGAFGTGVSIQYPLPDIDGDGRPDPAIESVNGEFSLEAPEFIELDLGSFFLDGFLREVPSLSPSGEAAPARTTESENESSASVTSPSTNSREAIGFSTIDGIGDDPRSYYRFYLDGEETEVSGITNSMGEFNTVLPPSTGFRLFVYTPSSNRFRIEIGETSESGSRTSVTTTAEFFGGVDSDNDGIPDVGEITIGTSDQNRDTDGDGISDAAEIAQGLDPLGGRGFPTGVIASLPLLGEALEITVVGGTNDATRQTAFLATGSHGLAIVDASKFNNPIVLGQLDLPGQNTGVAVDPTLSWAAVGSSEGLHFVDVSDPMMPRLELTVDGRFGQVEWIGGIAYAVQGQNILGFDPRSGERLSSEIVPGSGQVTMASEGGKLYAFSFGSNTLSVLEPRGSQINVLGELPGIAISNIVNVTVGNDLVVLGGAGSSTPNGLVTIDVSNPADMRIISGPDFFFDARGLARNGSGLALVGSEIPGVGVGIYGISDPENTNDFRQQIPTSGPALSVAIASGIAFVASERSGLQVINYLPFDTAGQAPTVALALNVDAVDIGPDEPGIQVLEGSTIPVSVDSTDDVQVRNVELLVDGQVVQNAVSFPFNLAAVAPVLGDGMEKAEFTIQARATDTGGNTALSDLITVDMRPDTFPPIIDRFDVNLPDEDPEVPGSQLIGKANLRVFFAASDTGSLKTVELLLNGEVIAVEDRPVGVIQFATASLAAGEAFRDVELRLRATDRAGNATLSDPLAYRVVPDTFPPNISTINLADGDVNSTGLFSFNLGFSEPMDLNTLTSAVLVLNGPIGSIEPESVLLNANGRGMQVRYQLPVEGAFTLTIDAPALTDRAGNPLGDAPVSIDFDVQEQASPLFPGRRFASGEVPRSATTGNFNNDGVTDLVTANAGSDDVSVLLGNGDGTFASQQRFAAGASPMSLTTGDFNGDGVTDVVTANAGSDDVSVLLGNGDGTFALQQRFGVGDEPSFVTTGDFNGDGVNDLVTANRKSDDVSMLLGNGDGTFASQQHFPAGADPFSLTTGDFNADGLIDLVTANRFGNNVSVLLGNGDGTFASQQQFPVGDGPLSVTTGDFNADGLTDLVTANALSDDVSVLLGSGDGTFATQQRFGVANGPRSLTTGDFNTDGLTDLVTTNPNSDDISVLLGNGDGTFASQQRFATGNAASSATTGDFNGDGTTDVVTANAGSDDVSVLLGNEDGTFASQQRYTAGNVASSAAMGDFDADGVIDLVATNANSDDISVLLGDGDGTFASQQRYDAGDGPVSVKTGDFNGDGVTDLVTANQNSDDVSVLLGNGDGTFASQQRFTADEGPFSVTTGDFNGDGVTDLVTANLNSNDVSVLLGSGDGTFASQQRFAAGDGPVSVKTGDVNGDGVTDLVTANLNSNDVSVLLGSGDGTFASQQRFSAGEGTFSVTTGDFNADGLIDLVTANRFGNNVSVLLGNGDGTFASQQQFPVGDGPLSVTTGDFNADGLTDLITANRFGDNVSVLLGNGDGTFVSDQRFGVSDDPVFVTTGDINADGLTDLVTANFSDSISVLLNQPG